MEAVPIAKTTEHSQTKNNFYEQKNNWKNYWKIKHQQKKMNKYTIIWEDRWQTGSHWHSITKRTWVESKTIHDVMQSEYGKNARFIFEGHLCSLGEKFRMDDVVYICSNENTSEHISHEYHD